MLTRRHCNVLVRSFTIYIGHTKFQKHLSNSCPQIYPIVRVQLMHGHFVPTHELNLSFCSAMTPHRLAMHWGSLKVVAQFPVQSEASLRLAAALSELSCTLPSSGPAVTMRYINSVRTYYHTWISGVETLFLAVESVHTIMHGYEELNH